MSRNNDGLPMLPPWLSESEVTQVGYEAPVQNLPHEELIDETPHRKRGRLRNRAPEAERPEAARPDKRRKGWRRDKHDEHPAEEQRPNDQGTYRPEPEAPQPAQRPLDPWQQLVPEQAPAPQADFQPDQAGRTDPPQRGLPTRNPSQPSPGFQPLGSRSAEPVQADHAAAYQPGRPDLPPPPPIPAAPSMGASSVPSSTGPQPAPWQNGGSPAMPIGNGPSTPPAAHHAPPPSAADHVAAPLGEQPVIGAAGASQIEGYRPVGGSGTTPAAGEQPAVPTGAGHNPPPIGSHPTVPTTDNAPGQSAEGRPPVPQTGTGRPAAPSTDGPTAPPTDHSPAPSAGHYPAASTDRSTAPPTDRTAAPRPGPDRMPGQGDHSAIPPTGEPLAGGHSPTGAGQLDAPSPAPGPGPASTGSDGPPPWLAAAPGPGHESASGPTDAPRRLPPLPDPPTPRDRPHDGPPVAPQAADDRRPPPRGADGPPPWLGHTDSAPAHPTPEPAPDLSGTPGPGRSELVTRTGQPPGETGSTPVGSPPTAESPTPTPAPEPRLRANRRPASGLRPADRVGAEPTAARMPEYSDLAPAPAPQGDVSTADGAPIPTPEPPASSWTVSAVAGATSARPPGRHRLPAETEQRPDAGVQGESTPEPGRPLIPGQQFAATPNDMGYPRPGPHGSSLPPREKPGAAAQFTGAEAPEDAPAGPPEQWRNVAGYPAAAEETTRFTGAPAPVGDQPADHSRNSPAQPRLDMPEQSGHPAPYIGAPGEQHRPIAQDYGQPAPQTGGPQWGNPLEFQQPSAHYQPPSLENVPLRRAKKAPGSGWRKAVHHVSGGAINPGMSAEERRLQELVARIRQPVRGDYRIAVLSLKGGVGKTTTTMGIGSIFASIRGDRVIAVDANPDFGTLSQRVPLQTRSTVRDLLLDSSIQRYSDVRRHTSQATSRLEVLASERDPAASEAFSEEEYRAVARILQRFYNIILTDCGTGLMHSAMSGVLDLAHSLVLISSPAIDGARSAAATLDWLSLHGHDHLVRNAVVVINSPRAGSPNVGIQQLREYFLSRCRAVHIIPFDPHMSEGAEIDLHRLHKQTKRAYVELAATVADDFATDHHRYRP